ncbi:MAG: hypothetical protein HY904_11205 [Deltaproteobacteria bacterium]|nr:hypothetical protein [Deltaproteobacteria bacterium]
MATDGVLGDALAPEARDALARRLVEGGHGEMVQYGVSVQGRPLLAGRLPGPRPDAPRLLLAANIHGVEFVGARAALRFLQDAVEARGGAGQMRAHAELWVAPCLNPDGYARTFAQGGVGTLKELRTNAHGVDLNRNFPRPDGGPPSRLPFTGSSNPAAATFRGTAPLSEPETAALDALLAAQRFHAVVSLHSFMGSVIPARVTDAPSYAAYGRLFRAFTAAQTRWRFRRMQSRVVDAFTGELEDHVHHVHHGWATCVELFTLSQSARQHLRAPSVFWRFNPRDLDAILDHDTPAVAAWLRAALDEPRPGPAVA